MGLIFGPRVLKKCSKQMGGGINYMEDGGAYSLIFAETGAQDILGTG